MNGDSTNHHAEIWIGDEVFPGAEDHKHLLLKSRLPCQVAGLTNIKYALDSKTKASLSDGLRLAKKRLRVS